MEYITFISTKPLRINTRKNRDGTLEYSFDNKIWTIWDGSAISSELGIIYMRGTNNTNISGNCNWNFITNGELKALGNIENLLDYHTVSKGKHPPMGICCFAAMFHRCLQLVQAPELPAIKLTEGCYEFMFSNCISLTRTPELPAKKLAPYCYYKMFRNCTSLVNPLQLPAKKLVKKCYASMFENCIILPELPKFPKSIERIITMSTLLNEHPQEMIDMFKNTQFEKSF